MKKLETNFTPKCRFSESKESFGRARDIFLQQTTLSDTQLASTLEKIAFIEFETGECEFLK